MSRLGAKTYSRKQECRTSVQFENLLSEKGNKPSTAKVSVAGVHRWGMTSYTSLRKSRINGQKTTTESVEPVKRMKLDLEPCSEDPFSFETDVTSAVIGKNDTLPKSAKTDIKPAPPKPNKFFKSGSRGSKNSSKNNDFDALRLSVPPSLSSLKGNKDNVLLNLNPNSRDDFTRSSEVYDGNPGLVDLRDCNIAPDTCSSNKYSSKPNLHYINSLIQPVVSSDASSRAFDALLGLDLPSKTDMFHHMDSTAESLGYINDNMSSLIL